jgi:hypothetical protein
MSLTNGPIVWGFLTQRFANWGYFRFELENMGEQDFNLLVLSLFFCPSLSPEDTDPLFKTLCCDESKVIEIAH